MEELLSWISTHPFKKEGPCDCDFEGDWTGNGVCVGCRHPVEYFKDGWCTFPVMYNMSAQEVKEEIVKYIKEQ